jgi:glutamate-1-semialdehyde 2,1-aminomutase
MDFLAPVGPVYQAGTLSGNPLAMAAGLAMLKSLDRSPEIYKSLEEKTAYLHTGLDTVLNESGLPYVINRVRSMISVHFTEEAVVDFKTSVKGNNETFRKFFHGMLKRGIYLPPSAFESWFLNDALTYNDLDLTIDACRDLVKTL